ncbi:hypothetical protein [Bacillus sp. CHD6a]|uniref:hypothetical protein n=1 Tax=Bacillus sp. CHD6a TaxID=1643452 RepID=UPI0006CDDF49|nr:hypothetical protein [Bacillus sp. CHD6a]KPB05619.1 hypothetical protein AAV98_04775 [Bacillus sp. CHD6a]
MSKNPRLESDHFKQEMDHFISPNSLFTSVDQERVLERIRGAKKRKSWWGHPRIVLSVLLLFIVSGTLYGVMQTTTDNETISADFVLSNVSTGMSKQEVRNILGTNYVKVEQSMDSGPIFTLNRYDFPVEEGYVFESQMDFLDIEGVRSGRMRMQVIVQYDGELVEGYSIIFNEENGKTVIHRVFGDEIKVIPVD